jgi:bifunctional non-homologous end joining protein LigD
MTAAITAPQTQRITLYYREGSSDKVYQAWIEPQGDLFLVNFAFGRRGTTLSTGTKTQTPVDHDTATRIFNKLVSEKKAKGYTEGPEGTPCQHTENENRTTGILPQLLNPIEESEVQRFIEDPRYCAQEKFDGRRILSQKAAESVGGINRRGLTVGLPETILGSTKAIPGDFIVDGECVGDLFHAFDILQGPGFDLTSHSYQQRLVALMNLMGTAMQKHIHIAETAFAPGQKRDLLNWLRRENKEGIVFKRLDAHYTPGRPNSGGPQPLVFVVFLCCVFLHCQFRGGERLMGSKPPRCCNGAGTLDSRHAFPLHGFEQGAPPR